MESLLKKLFGGISLTWTKLVVIAIISGVFTAVVAIIPALDNSSFFALTTSFEVWILFGIFIIMNSKSNLDAALKCFVFFLISQPLIYLLQVPFSYMGWGLFSYYKYWFVWTICCFPMGFIGYYMKKGKWWGYLILFPMIVVTATSYYTYFSHFLFYIPRYILICIFCVVAMIFYPVAIFEDKKIKVTGVVIGIVFSVVITAYMLIKPPVYSTEIMSNGDEYRFDDTYKVYLENENYGDVKIVYDDMFQDYVVHADFKKGGKTKLTLESPSGDKQVVNLEIEYSQYKVKPETTD